MKNRNRELAFVVIAVLVLSCITLAGPDDRQPRGELYGHYETFARIVNTVRQQYVDDVEIEELFQNAYSGMLQGLDPYSAFLPPEALEDLDVETRGEFGGLGIEITINEQGWLTVITPMEGTPAFEAGVMAGDIIIEIEGESTQGIELRQAVNKLRGPKGEPVTITVLHETGQERKITIVRDIIELQSIKAAEIIDEDAGIGYIRLSAFQANTPQELDEAVARLKDQGMKALVIDLRFNPGGLLNSAIQVADRFIEEGVIVSTKGRAQADREFKAQKQGTYDDFPVVTLISRRSASASEIFAGAMQDHRRGLLVGSRTHGKGSVQTVFPFRENRSAIRLTTAYYYTPSGRLIHRRHDDKEQEEWGIVPDHEVDITLEEEARLWNHWREQHIRRIREMNDEKPEVDRPDDEREQPQLPQVDEDTEVDEEPFRDRALEAAVAALKTVMWTQQQGTPARD